ncbi:MAG TPA: M15 family metallopeptidase [Candidatus Rifleibacterium sp.]|mgnify:CR=1 FL=1|nr:M15 family metallopeptidase [Candidatus Rifleibacterium sp.]
MNRLDTLEPGFRETTAHLLQAATTATGYQWVIISGRRTMAEQKEIYAQGRTKPGKVVTNAAPGSSAHNFGLAADVAPLRNGKIWWGAPREVWRQMADLAQGMGLVAGFYFTTIFDAPHIEAPNWRDVRAAWRRGEISIA